MQCGKESAILISNDIELLGSLQLAAKRPMLLPTMPV